MKLHWLILAVAITAFIICGCSDVSRISGTGGQPAPTPCADLVSLGRACIWIGGAALVLGVIARIALAVSFVNPIAAILSRIPGVSGIATTVAECGAIALACGVIMSWLGQNPWAMVAAIVAALVAWAWHRRALLRRWYDAWTHHKTNPQG